MRKLLFQGIVRSPLTEPAPAADDADARDPRREPRAGSPPAPRPEPLDPEVDAGSCNACELEIHALNNAFYDLERFGLRFVASPRHADVLMVTGPVTKNMREALERTYAATPAPKWVVAVGNCALDGGIFAGSYAVDRRRLGASFRSTWSSAGCPPSPTALLKGLLALLQSADASSPDRASLLRTLAMR